MCGCGILQLDRFYGLVFMIIIEVTIVCLLALCGPFILYFSRHPSDLHRFLIYLKRHGKKLRFKGSTRDLIFLCSSQVFYSSLSFCNDFLSLDYCTSHVSDIDKVKRYLYISNVYNQCSFLNFSVNSDFSKKVIKSSFDRYHESELKISSLLNGSETEFDSNFVTEIEKYACSSEEIDQNLYYYKLLLLVFLRSDVIRTIEDTSYSEVSSLVDFMRARSEFYINELAHVYDAVRPYISSEKRKI